MKVQDLHQEILCIELQILTDRFNQDCVHDIYLRAWNIFTSMTVVATVLKVIKKMFIGQINLVDFELQKVEIPKVLSF